MFNLNSVHISQSIKVRLIVCFVSTKTLRCLPASALHNLKSELYKLWTGDWVLALSRVRNCSISPLWVKALSACRWQWLKLTFHSQQHCWPTLRLFFFLLLLLLLLLLGNILRRVLQFVAASAGYTHTHTHTHPFIMTNKGQEKEGVLANGEGALRLFRIRRA